MRPVIQVEHLSKHYRLGLIGGGTLREDLHRWWAKARGRPDPLLKIGQEDHGNREGGELWALRDVSFQVQEGEILGIIGRNGAGKSTLLKILSRITAPTTGQVKIRGRVGSLLEVGTGFHPELTGRENIYLNGAILGMKKAEIDRKLDEIIDFAEIEQFIDTPVKRYSSGMYVRLAFAVAAHLEPEILVVDEVLAVGDAAFQKKCLGKMGDVAQGGKTVLFVSHNMAAVQQLCQRGCVLTKGGVSFNGDINTAVSQYISRLMVTAGGDLEQRTDRKGTQWLKLTKAACYNSSGIEIAPLLTGQDVTVRVYYRSKKIISSASVCIAFNVRNAQGYLLANLNSIDTGNSVMDIGHEGYFECHWPRFNLRAGAVTVQRPAIGAGSGAAARPARRSAITPAR